MWGEVVFKIFSCCNGKYDRGLFFSSWLPTTFRIFFLISVCIQIHVVFLISHSKLDINALFYIAFPNFHNTKPMTWS